MTGPIPTAADIASGAIVENQRIEFKREVNLGDPCTKSNLVDDVVGFLNAGAGHLVIGVAERKGVFDGFKPITEERDQVRRRFTSVLQDNVSPKPMGIGVDFIDVDGGYIVHVALPEHRMRPYQNTLNGAFHIRTGAQNTPVARDAVRALFTPIETMEADVARLMEREDRAVEERDIMQNGGASLHVAIIPLEHYDRAAPPFTSGHRGIVKTFPDYHYEGAGVFKGCDGGVERRDSSFDEGRSTSRFFIGDDWSLHSYVAHPFAIDESDRLTLHEFRDTLSRHMNAIALIADESGLRGPFCTLLAVRNLRRGEKLRFAFPTANKATLPRGVVVEQVNDATLASRFYDLVLKASRYG